MNHYISTPFDSLILELVQSTLRNPAYGALTSVGNLALNQLKFLRVIYLDYALMKVQNLDDLYFNKTNTTRQLSSHEILQVSDDGIRVMLRYLSVIDVLNQFGRCLNRLTNGKENIPLHAEIHFFRNKIVEHWDDGYFPLKPGGSYTRSAKKLPVPILNGGRCFVQDIPVLEKQLRDMFAESNVDLGDLSDLHGCDYSQKIYTLLKQIDHKLRSQSKPCSANCKKDMHTGIPDDLVKMLFKFEFPLPIYDLDEYCSQLVTYLRTLKLFKKSNLYLR